MTICGIELSASEARLVLLEDKKDDLTIVDTKPRKIKLNDEADQNEVKAFRDTIFAFFRENQVTVIAIKKRGKKGAFSGGSVGFKLEGIIQLYDECPVILVSPQTISAAKKRYEYTIPKEIMKYQHIAFETAFTKLS
ncbi:MAG: DUF3010 family protein [Desulfobulbia bacterium]